MQEAEGGSPPLSSWGYSRSVPSSSSSGFKISVVSLAPRKKEPQHSAAGGGKGRKEMQTKHPFNIQLLKGPQGVGRRPAVGVGQGWQAKF